MPHHPTTASAARALRPSVFASLASQLRALERPPIPLHLGDAYRAPPDAARLEVAAARLPANGYAYANPLGLEPLRDAVAARCADDGLPGLTRDHVHVCVGATAAIQTALATWLQPGDEVLVCAPFWPLVKGMVLALGAVPVEVPFYGRLRRGETVADVLAPHVTPRTVALYVTSPNNPCGTVLSTDQLQDVADFAIARSLWVVADEAYHHYAWAPHRHQFLAALPGMATRTATVFTASKSYALAGVRIGFLCGDPAWLDVARRVATHTVYNVPLVCQLSALGAIETGGPWIAETRALYEQARDLVVQRLDAPFDLPMGGAYVFADLGADLAGKPMLEFLSDLLRAGVSLSPGDAFGRDFSSWVRICYTSAPLADLATGIDRLNGALERLRRDTAERASRPRTGTDG